MADKLQNDPITIGWRRSVMFILLVIMMASVFFSRALLSVSMIAFVLFSFLHRDFKRQLVTFFTSPLLLGMSILFLLPAVSGLWSRDEEQWMDIVRIKLPLLVMPLAFAAPFGLSKRQWRGLIVLFIAFVTAGTLWSMAYYISDIKTVHENYLRSQILITPLGNDHVRFSWMVCAAVLFSAFLWWKKKIELKKNSWLLIAMIAWLIAFLHILAARTGLFCFYFILFITAVWFVFMKWKARYGLGILAILIVLPLIAYFTLPTFQNRVKYFLYDLPYFSKVHYHPGMNDAVRVISLKAGWNIMNEHPVAGVGFGDVLPETQKWDVLYYSPMLETDKIYPSSEWLIYGAGCGWPGFILFTMIMIIPFTLKIREDRLCWLLLNTTAGLTFLFDIGLEVQFGVFVYSFVTLLCWKWLRAES
ncbi:MAG: O-antigen ligase family protein [Chitinophagales bacterium]